MRCWLLAGLTPHHPAEVPTQPPELGDVAGAGGRFPVPPFTLHDLNLPGVDRRHRGRRHPTRGQSPGAPSLPGRGPGPPALGIQQRGVSLYPRGSGAPRSPWRATVGHKVAVPSSWAQGCDTSVQKRPTDPQLALDRTGGGRPAREARGRLPCRDTAALSPALPDAHPATPGVRHPAAAEHPRLRCRRGGPGDVGTRRV